MPLQRLHPRRWSPPRAPERARRESSDQPLPPLRRIELPGRGPEDVVVDAAGHVLTGVADGRILRVDPHTDTVETVARTGGRPLGLEVCPDGTILVCDSRRGLLHVDPATRRVDVLVDTVDGERLNFASNVVRAADGTIYFTSSCRGFDVEHYLGDIIEHSGTGRLFRRDADGTVATLLDGLDFANGVALAPDESSLVFAQTAGYCLTRYHLTGPQAGTAEPLVENLPGFPDNIARGSDGLIWVSIPTARNPLLDRLLPLPGVLRQGIWLLPELARPRPSPMTWVMAFADDGTLIHDLQSATAGYSMVTSAIEHDGAVFLGSLAEPAIAVVALNP